MRSWEVSLDEDNARFKKHLPRYIPNPITQKIDDTMTVKPRQWYLSDTYAAIMVTANESVVSVQALSAG